MRDAPQVPPTSAKFSPDQASGLARELFGVDLPATPMPSYLDENFRLGDEFVLKIAHAGESRDVLDLQNCMMDWLWAHGGKGKFQRAMSAKDGTQIVEVTGTDGTRRLVRLVTFLPGTLMANVPRHSPGLLRNLGEFLGQADAALAGFEHRAAGRRLVWDLTAGGWIRKHLDSLIHPARRRIVERFLTRFDEHVVPALSTLRRGVIHNDGNDHNVLVDGDQVVGLLDFGDAVENPVICELAIALAYAILDKHDPLEVAEHVVAGYHAAYPLEPRELETLFDLVAFRLCVSVTMSARRFREDPENEYILISERPAWVALEQLSCIDPDHAHRRLRAACGLGPESADGSDHTHLEADRSTALGTALSLSYRRPIKVVRGSMQFLFDDEGRSYLDCVNNVCHVGHCHPHVVQAGQRQMELLNTNTRYLHDTIVHYARRLTATLPGPLSVCYLVCTGSEANELALRMARAYTGARDVITVDGAYHGNTGGLVDISPYKFAGPGGRGAPDHVHVIATPDVYRNPLGVDLERAGPHYAKEIDRVVGRMRERGRDPAAFICESVMSCAGQIVLPEDYLAHAHHRAREAGAVCIADEVQVGFGRVGSHMWGFETQGVVPDIVTLGKPIGNGHPLAAVVTTPEIAAAFDNGMEYFNTFGGNPVSTAIGMAVLDVIEDEGLQAHAHEVGTSLAQSLTQMARRHPLVGDVRGLGMFLGVELVRDHETLDPADTEASDTVELLRNEGILVSTDGPLHNVLKLKPPLQFTAADADRLVRALDAALTRVES